MPANLGKAEVSAGIRRYSKSARFFMSWKTPLERYQPLASRNREAVHETKDDDEDDNLDDEAGW